MIDLFKRPADARAVLAHLERGGRDAARVCRLAGGKEYLVLQEHLGRLCGRGHIRSLADCDAAVLYKLLCVLGSKLVLRGARESYVAGHAPDFFALVKFRVRALLGVFAYPCAANLFYLLERRNVDAVRVIDESARIARRDYFSAEAQSLLYGVGCDVARAGDDDRLALDRVRVILEHLLNKIDKAVARCLCSCERAAERESLAREHALVLTRYSLILTEHIADFAPADPDIARGNVGVRAYDAVERGHKALAEAHYLHLALALGVEVRAALAAANGKSGQRVFEYLLEAEEFYNAHVDRGMKAQTAFIRAYRAVELDSVAAVCVNLARVVRPRDAENRRPLRLNEPFEQRPILIYPVRLDNRANGIENLRRSLNELRLSRVLLLNVKYHVVNIAHIITPKTICGDKIKTKNISRRQCQIF